MGRSRAKLLGAGFRAGGFRCRVLGLGFRLQLSYLQLEFWGISVEIFSEEWIYEAFHSEFQHFHQLAFCTFNKVVTYQLVSHPVATDLLDLLWASASRAPSRQHPSKACCKRVGLGWIRPPSTKSDHREEWKPYLPPYIPTVPVLVGVA